MKNEYGLPQVVVNALSSNEYIKRPGYSATTLIKPPQMKALQDRYEEDEQDVMDRLWSVLGTAVHNVMEKYVEEEAMAEAYYNSTVLGCGIHGTVDHYRAGVISDFKITSAWKYVNKDFAEWEQQLNTYAYLMKDKFPVHKLQIIAIFRDWSAMQAKRSPNYPQQPIVVIPIPIWESEQQFEYIASRVELHEEASKLSDDQLPQCSDKDRWATPDKWAVYKTKNKTATKLCDTEEEANEVARKLVGQTRIEFRPGESKRCMKYCPVASHCMQYARSARV